MATVSIEQRLGFIISAGLTTAFAISVTLGITEEATNRILAGQLEPTDEHRATLEDLLSNYAGSIKGVNAATLKRRL